MLRHAVGACDRTGPLLHFGNDLHPLADEDGCRPPRKSDGRCLRRKWMRTVRRSMRNLARAKLRSGLLASVLGISMALALIMLTVDGAFATRLDEIKQEVGTDIAVRPAGSFGGVGA